MKKKNKKPSIKKVITIIAFILATAIGCYGLAIAPSKSEDTFAKELESEMERNKQLIAEQNSKAAEEASKRAREIAESIANEESLAAEQESISKEAEEQASIQAETTTEETTTLPPTETTTPAPTETTTPAPTETTTIPAVNTYPVEGLVTCIGDSVMLGAADQLYVAIPGCIIDAQVSRHAYQAVDVINSLRAQGQLGTKVVIGLGTNSAMKYEDGQEIIACIGEGVEIYFVTAYMVYQTWYTGSNDTIYALAANYPNVHVIDWYGAVQGHRDYLSPNDGIHLTTAGKAVYANLIGSSIQ